MSKINLEEFRFCVAPMMGWTDRHDRFFLRLISKKSRLYTEMLTADAILHGDRDRLLGFHPAEHAVALQLGGSDAAKLGQAAAIGVDYGYDEINLNIGCPSDRVQSGRFGACLMKEPDVVADCVAAMCQKVDVPVTVKCRIGVDDQDTEQALFTLVEKSAAAGCKIFIVHARKAWLQGLSPKKNRDVPPLDYDLVYKLKQMRPDLCIVLNGGIETLAHADLHLEKVDGVMLGRAAYKNPYMLSEVDARFFNDMTLPSSREQIIEQLISYAETITHAGIAPHALRRHVMGLYQAQPGGRLWRRALSENISYADTVADVLRESLVIMRDIQEQFTHKTPNMLGDG